MSDKLTLLLAKSVAVLAGIGAILSVVVMLATHHGFSIPLLVLASVSGLYALNVTASIERRPVEAPAEPISTSVVIGS